MKTTQYVRQLKVIGAGDANLTREWWMFGLRLLRDSEAMSPTGLSLRHGAAEKLIAAAGKDAKGQPRLSIQKIQRALRCARTYQTDAQIRHAVTDFETWRDLVDAGFPPYEADPDEPPADHRTDDERRHDRARTLAEAGSDQLALFPLDRFEPVTTTLKELTAYAEEMAELTARFAARDRERREYLDALVDAVDGDLSATWQEADESWRRSTWREPPPGGGRMIHHPRHSAAGGHETAPPADGAVISTPSDPSRRRRPSPPGRSDAARGAIP